MWLDKSIFVQINTDAKENPSRQNIKRIREMLGIKHEVLEHELGEDWSQKKISLLEQRETVEMEMLRQLSEILRIPVVAIGSSG